MIWNHNTWEAHNNKYKSCSFMQQFKDLRWWCGAKEHFSNFTAWSKNILANMRWGPGGHWVETGERCFNGFRDWSSSFWSIGWWYFRIFVTFFFLFLPSLFILGENFTYQTHVLMHFFVNTLSEFKISYFSLVHQTLIFFFIFSLLLEFLLNPNEEV